MVYDDNGTWDRFCLLIGPHVVLPSRPSPYLRIKYRTDGFMGKQRASVRIAQLYTLRTTDEADGG